jgi:hypothetical protein
VQLFGPVGVGRAELAGLVETVRTLFEAQTLGTDLVDVRREHAGRHDGRSLVHGRRDHPVRVLREPVNSTR